MDWEKLGLKMGLEIHQQLNTKHKLFCPCKTELVDEDYNEIVERNLRPTQSELGEIDRAALQESLRGLNFKYESYDHHTCLVESDDEPPHSLNKEALETMDLRYAPSIYLFERKRVTDDLCKTKHKSSKGEWNLKNREKIMKYLNETENPYILKIGDVIVKFEYSDVKKTFKECMLNILNKKNKTG